MAGPSVRSGFRPAYPVFLLFHDFCVKSSYRNRVETETDFLVGKHEELLRKNSEGWKIARRKIVLDQNVLLAKNLTFFF